TSVLHTLSLHDALPISAAGFTMAVNVTAWPKADGFSEEINVVADKEEPGRPQDVNLKDPMRVFQLNEPFVVRYSFVYQKVQSSRSEEHTSELQSPDHLV